MDIIWYHPTQDGEIWLAGLRRRLPQARVRRWQPGDDAPADYAILWQPPREMLAHRAGLRGVFVMGAGVDDILARLVRYPDMLPPSVPLVRLEDSGMARQMQEYALYCVLGWFRRFDDYARQQQQAQWQPLPPTTRETFSVGVLGAGVLGQSVIEALRPWGFPLRVWSRTPKRIPGVESFAGRESLDEFLRGAQVVEADLLAALESGQLRAAALDVFQQEPLPQENPLWRHPRVTVTPHIAALTLTDKAMDAITRGIGAIEAGERPSGCVDRQRGY